ncbi:hypothetical protein M422DRAFT_92787, partial [Sphaerobolus stellatus SS14]
DKQSCFWIECERIRKQSYKAFLERDNRDLDVQLIFAGLFSTVSSAFIIQMQADLQPDATETTNSLLALLVNGTLNRDFTNMLIILPSSLGFNPQPLIIGKQALGYLSLSLSLLVAFGVVLRKQW